MKLKLFCLFVLCALSCALYAELNGTIEYRITSELTSYNTSGSAIDRVNISSINRFITGETHGAIDTVYRGERTIASSGSDVLGMVGSLTNAIGETVSFATVKAVFVENRNGTQTLTLSSGIATTSILPYGSFSLVGSYPISTNFDRMTLTNSNSGSTTYRIWIVGTR